MPKKELSLESAMSFSDNESLFHVLVMLFILYLDFGEILEAGTDKISNFDYRFSEIQETLDFLISLVFGSGYFDAQKMDDFIEFARRDFNIEVSFDEKGAILFKEIGGRVSEPNDIFIVDGNKTNH
jgi:hypothetical protein